MKIVISNHAVDRFRQRFRYLMPRAVLCDPRNIRFKINQMIDAGYEDPFHKMVPFYYNARGAQTVYRLNDVVIICRHYKDEDVLFVKTIYKQHKNKSRYIA